MADKFRFIINTSVNYFNASPPKDENPIEEFFENDEINLLAATVREQIISFHHRIPSTEENCLLFYKIPQLGLSQNSSMNNSINTTGHKIQDETSIGILTLEGGIIKSIYNSVSRIFSPNVLKKSDYTPEIAKMIENLHTTLGTTLGLPDSGIQNIQDEINFWMKKSTNSPTKSDKEQAKIFASALLNIDQQLEQLKNSNTFLSIEEFIDNTHNNLDEIWKLQYHYPQNRMGDIMDVICSNLIEICIENLSNEDIWNSNSIHINTLIGQVSEIVETWIQVCDTLTRLFWPNYGLHSWIGEPHLPKAAIEFKLRLAEIKNIKNLYKQVFSLFNDDDNYVKMLNKMFLPFREINIFDTSPIGQQRWRKSVTQFESILEPIDNTISSILKSQLHNHLDNPRQVVHIFSKYDLITRRQSILESLTAEREHFLQTVSTLISDLQTAIIQNSGSGHDNEDLTPVVMETRWLKIVEYQLFQIEKILHICTDRNGYQNVDKLLKSLKNDVASTLKENFQKWCDDSLFGVKSGDLKLRDDKPVVEFEKHGRQFMRVTFNPKIVVFCHDIREFENLGFKVPIELRDSATHALKFMTYARALQQIASFHNTIGDRMIACQRPIMLKNAIELSNLVQSESVAWNDEDSVRRYVKILQTAINKLSKDNTLLAGYHEQAKRTIKKLMSTDLLRQSQSWKDEMRHLRELIASLESQGYTNLQAFKLHWDHQLYKVLEYQYITGLIDLNHKLPDISIDLVFRQQQLQFKPPIEEIRSKYYSQLRRFIERPLGFHGLSEQSNNLFKIMVERNRIYFSSIYKRSEELIRKLGVLKNVWKPWVALGATDLEDLCNVHLSTWEDWDMNFKACKHYSQKIAKIQNTEERIDCLVINLLPLRSDMEFISRRYWEALSISLRSSILENVSTLQEYLQSALQTLQNVPLDDTGIADAGAKYEKIVTDLPKMTNLIKSTQEKDTCLAGWCKERVASLNSVLLQYEQLQPLIDNHHSILQRQIDIMKDHIGSQTNNLNEEIEKFQIRWESTLVEMEANENSDLALFKERQNQWNLIKEKSDRLLSDSIKFNTKFPEDIKTLLDKIEKDVQDKKQYWNILENFYKELDEIFSEEWTVYRRRPYILIDFLNKWQNSIKLEKSTVNTRILQQIQKFQNILPILQSLQSDALTEKHWARIFMLLKKSPKPYHEILLKDILMENDELSTVANEIQNLVRQATSEQIVRQALTELEQWGVTAILKLTSHTDSKGQTVMLIKDFQDVLNKIGDNQCLLQSAKNSTAFDAFSDQAEIWESRLNSLDRILTSFNQIQRKWIYLEPIFGAGTLRNEEALFIRIDKDFRYITKEVANDSRVLSICKINNIMSVIDSLENQLSRCQNTLTSYITTKRNAFPRFYFLGNDDLLEILGQASKEPIIQKHIKKLFPGINRVGIVTKDNNISFISTIHSSENDEIKLKNIIPINVPVEDWLNKLVSEIKLTLKELIVRCTEITGNFTLEQIHMFPMQVLCLAKFISFTKRTEKAIVSMGLQSLLKSTKDEISYYATQINNTKDSLLQIKIRSILLDLVHQSSILEYLIETNVTNQNDWNWLQQLKFYLNNQNQCVTIKMVYAEFEYSYEYLGNSNKLVNTMLTHKCYLTLTQAMHLGLGGNPFGPAGTGKTECVKALGAMLGRLVLVFNCNENVDTTAMGLILSGLARCGAWGCFDEFNRLQEATLSAISMLIQPLQIALKEKQENVTILDDPLPLNLHCGIFVTLNPAGEEYGGRQNLPANLQALFRPIVMQQPEPKEIARVLLFVEGFKNAEKIGYRMVELFVLASKMLSPQRHYDWGLRELKTVLTAAGKALRDSSEIPTDEEEIELTVRTLRMNTMSKLTLTDCKRFDMLIADVFPNVEILVNDESLLKTAISEIFSSMGLQINNRQISKCLELYEQLQKRMGVVIIGPPSSGKTTLITVLKQALTSLSKTIKTYTIAPKSMTRTQLLGKLDPDTRQWNDGVLTTTAVSVNSELPDITSWIICDGDIDPEWIEALNSVLDDNRLLTLPSGWRIQFGNNVNFIFETHDLAHASPATISRMGIINLSSEDLNEKFIIESWLSKQLNIDILRIFIEEYFMKALNWILKHNKESSIEISKIGLVNCGLQHLLNLDKKDEFCIGLIRGFGSFINNNKKNDFAKEILLAADLYVADQLKAEYSYYNEYRDSIEVYENDQEVTTTTNDYNDQDNLIKTATIKVNLEVLRNFLKIDEKSSFLLYGPAGCGKTLLLQNAMTEFSGYQFITIKCSAQLTSSYVLYILRQNCLIVSGVRGREYKPRLSKLVLYFKNIDLCPIDCWGTNEVIELLLQLIHRNGFYADNMEWISIAGLQICGSFSDTTKSTLSPRFLSICRFLVVGYPNENEMQSIITHQFTPIYKKFTKTSKIISIDRIVNGLINIYSEIKNNFTSETSNHYIFTPKMMTNWIYGLMNYPDEYLQQAIFYEAKNIFQNRLISSDEILKFDEILATNLRNVFNIDKSIHYFIPTRAKLSTLEYMNEEIWMDIIQRNVSICANEDILISKPITAEFLSRTSSICRSLSQKTSNIILCGEIGSGRKESLHIACSVLHIKVFYTQPVRNYSLNEFYNDLKLAMQTAAIEDQTICFIIDQSLISFLSDMMKPIEAVLEGSEIPDLFGDDLEAVANPLRNAAQLEGYQDSLSSYFLKRVEQNLHLIILLESSSSELNELFSKYPALYRNTDMLWVHSEISEDLPKLMIDQLSPLNSPVPIPRHFSSIVQHSGDWSHSPLRYAQTINSYYYLYNIFSEKIKSHYEKLEAGVEKLATAHSVVATLKSDAIQQEEALAEKRKLAAQALEMISSTMRNATDQRTDLLELKKKTQSSSEILKERKKAIEIELKEVEPVLKEASAAVGQIKTEALSEIRSLRAPPDAIRDILEGVLRLMGIRDTSWNSMKTFLAKRGVKEDIKSLDPTRITPENCSAVEKLLQSKSESFEMRNAKRASAAAAPLAAWVMAIVKYSRVVQSIKPLEREQNELLRNLEESENQMKSLVSGLDDVDARVKELSTQLNGYTQEAAVIELKLQDARNTLNSAETLIEKLNSEFVNWNKQLDELKLELQTLTLKSFFVALCITHFSHLPLEERNEYLTNISEFFKEENFNLDEKIITDQDKLQWETMGLTPDSQSMQNAAILTKLLSLPYRITPIPLLVDPSGACSVWIEKYLTSQNKSFEITSQNAERFTYSLELGIRFGKILIIKDSHRIVPPLLSVITSEIHTSFNKKQLQVGNKFVDLHDDFKIILVTKMHRVELKEDIAAYITAIPFTITVSGLTDQLLSKTIAIKRPDLEEKRIKLLQNEGNLWKQRLELQDKLLYELSTAQGDILKNEKLIKTLNDVKESSSSIDKSLSESTEIRKKLMEDYNQFKELCSTTSKFYVGISKIYYISISTFTTIFLQVMEKNEEFDGDLIFRKIIRLIYANLSRSVVKSQYLGLALCICKNAFPDQISNKEWESFITNFITSDDINNDQSLPSWIRKDLTSKVLSLKNSHSQLYQNLRLEDENLWKNYMESVNSTGQMTNANKNSNNNNKNIDIPVNVSEFQKIMISQIFRPDQMVNTMMKSAAKMLGITSLSTPQLSIQQIFEESKSDEPVLLITLGGTDPTKELKDFAEQKVGLNKYMEISVGKGTEQKAILSVRKAIESGFWICLKNVHLIPHWLKTVEQEIYTLNLKQEFRMFLTCETIKGFPDSFMSKCNKILYEAPDGVKNKIQRLLQQWSTMLSGKRDPKIIKLYIILFILNAILQERRSFIPQGWCKWYEFGDSDLRAAIDFIKLMENSISNQMEWSVLRGLCQNVVYGGRIDKVQDLEILIQHLEEFFDSGAMNSRWSPLGFNITIPQTNRIQDYYTMVAQFPDITTPEMFGLSKITNLSKDLIICRNLLKELRSSYFHTNDNDNFEKRIKPILSLWKKLSNGSSFKMNSSTSSTTIANEETDEATTTPWKAFLLAEMRIAKSLFLTIHSTLATLHSSMKQMSTMSVEEKSIMLSLCENQIPVKWRKIWSGPKLATDFLKAVTIRGTAAENRFSSETHLTFGDEIDLGTVFNVDALLAALKLTNARELSQSTCDLELKILLNENRGGYSDGRNIISLWIKPLLIDGAHFLNDRLAVNTENSSNKLNDFQSPAFHITYSIPKQLKTPDLENYTLPLYNNLSREILICNLPVQIGQKRNSIIYSGSALIVPDFPLS